MKKFQDQDFIGFRMGNTIYRLPHSEKIFPEFSRNILRSVEGFFLRLGVQAEFRGVSKMGAGASSTGSTLPLRSRAYSPNYGSFRPALRLEAAQNSASRSLAKLGCCVPGLIRQGASKR